MDKSLFEKYCNNTCSEQEREQVWQWLQDPAHTVIVQQWMQEHWNSIDIHTLPDPELENIWHTLQYKVLAEQASGKLPEPDLVTRQPKRSMVQWSLQIAASIVLLLVCALVAYQYLFNEEPQLVYQTQYGEVLPITLPDSSSIVLNGNSTLRIKADWDGLQMREVWLEGEGFFMVRHKPNQQKFLVHTSDHFEIEVVGTQFSVFRQQAQTRVVLNTGKIRLHVESGLLNKTQQFEVKPGELIEFYDTKQQLVRRQVNPTVYSAWKDHQLVFENTPLTEVASRLEATYGLHVILDRQVQHKRLTGRMEVENLDILIEAMASSFNLNITQQADTVHIQPNY